MSTPDLAPGVSGRSMVGAAAGWAGMVIDGIHLVLPQKEIRQISLVADLYPSASEEEREIGWLSHANGASWPAYCLDGLLGLQATITHNRRFCAFFSQGDRTEGVVCDGVWFLPDKGDLRVERVPDCMVGPRTPITGIARHEDGLAAVTSGSKLVSYLDFMKEGLRGADC